MYKTAYNTTAGPLAVDEAGHVIGGRDWGTVDTTDPVYKDLGDRVVLVDEDTITADSVPEAREAVERTRLIAERAEAFGKLDRERLATAAAEAGLIELELDDDGKPAGDYPTKGALVPLLAGRDDVAVPARSSAPKTAAAPAAESQE